MRKAYQTDLCDAEWSCLKPHLPAPKATGRPKYPCLPRDRQRIFYVLRSGCAWRLLPHDFPPWKTVYHYFRFWRLDGTWERMHSPCGSACGSASKQTPNPVLAIVDSQSVKTTGVGGKERGYDGAKKVKGRKRHLLVDTQGLVLAAKVHRANVTDRDGIKLLLEPAVNTGFPRLAHLWLDAGYTGQGRGAGWVEKTLGWTAEIVKHPPKPAPEEVMMRWVKEFNKEGATIDPKAFVPGSTRGPSCRRGG